MRATFRLTRADLIGLHKVIRRRLSEVSRANSKIFFSNLVIWIPIGIALAGYISLFRKYPAMTHDLAVIAAFFCIAIALMVAGVIFKQHTYRRALVSSDGWFLAEQSVELTPDGLSATGTYGEVRYTWRAFRHLMEDEANLYLFIDNGNAFVLPKAAFSPDQISEVKKWLQT